MQHKGTIQLDTPRLILRRVTMEDAEAAFNNWTSDPEVTKFLRWPAHQNISDTEKVLNMWVESYADPTFYLWGIQIKKTGQLIGTMSVVDMQEKTGTLHIGYCIGVPWWNQGYTSEALSRVIQFLFDEVGALRIESQHDPDNPHSGQVMAKCGLVYEGTLRKADWSNRGIVDACMYSLLKEEYEKG